MAMKARIASLGMYDSAGLHSANDRLWTAIAGHMRSSGVDRIPDALDRSRPLEAIWDDPDLLLAQTCGYPLMTRWRDRLRYVATPRYRAPGCDGATHRSRIVVRRDDPAETLGHLRGRTVALNDRQSNTGMNLLRALVAPLARHGLFFGAVVETGSHAASLRAVANGAADVAAIDGVTFAMLEQEMPEVTTQLRTLAWSLDAPALPFVTAAATPDSTVRTLRKAIRLAVQEQAAVADRLLLDGIENIGVRRYHRLLSFEMQSARAGYPDLA